MTNNQAYKDLNENIVDNVFCLLDQEYKDKNFHYKPVVGFSSGHYGAWKPLKLKISTQNYNMSVYFDHRIRISILLNKKTTFNDSVWTILIDPNGSDDKGSLVERPLPYDKDEYVCIISDFLIAFFHYVARLKESLQGYTRTIPRCCANADFPIYITDDPYDDMCRYPYSWDHKDILKYMTDVWESDELKEDMRKK